MKYPKIYNIASRELVSSIIMQFNANSSIVNNINEYTETEKNSIKNIIDEAKGIDQFYKCVFYKTFKIGKYSSFIPFADTIFTLLITHPLLIHQS